jgi:sugar lactone lactonase YvrE
MIILKRLIVVAITLFLLFLIYLFFWPVPIQPATWVPPQAPTLTGQYQQNSKLATVERLPVGFAPEDIAIDSQNRIYAGLDDGKIIRLQPDGSHSETFADTHGRPLGLQFDRNGSLIVADAIKGLVSISPNGVITTLSTEVDGSPFGATNDLDIAKDGTIYFTDASRKFPMTNYKADIVESQPNGRLLAYNPADKTTRVVYDDICFANGVAVSPDQSFVLVCETARYRVRRVWLTGLKQGQSDFFIDNLPGFPDGLSSNGVDRYWVALVTPRDSVLDKLLPHPFLRKAVLRLPKFLQPKPKRYAFVVALDNEGHVIGNLQDGSESCYGQIANVIEHDGFLYFGSIAESAIGRYRLRN